MKNKSLIILGGLLASLFIGCEDLKFGDNFLEKPNSDDVSIDTVFSSKKYADQAMNQFYKSLWDFMPTLRGCHPEGLILDGYTDIGYHGRVETLILLPVASTFLISLFIHRLLK